MSKKIIVIGGGFAGLSAATELATKGHDVTLVEKNETLGGRARKFESNGFVFDMGPSWYWMPEVFDQYFERYGFKTFDFYHLTRLDPSYKVVLSDQQEINVPAGRTAVSKLFEGLEKGASKNLDKFLDNAEYKYRVGMGEFVHKPSLSIFEYFDIRILLSAIKLNLFGNITTEIYKLFKHPVIRKILEFPVLFLGAKPENTPALYSLMNHADIDLGTWYPQGGMYKIIEGMVSVAKSKGVKFITNFPVDQLAISNKKITSVLSGGKKHETDAVIVTCDYRHFDQEVLAEEYRQYTHEYWEKRVMAPSSLLYYLGVKGKVSKLLHHNLFFDADFHAHASSIYDNPEWPKDPLFYVSCPSKTDKSVAPDEDENIFLLMPLAPGLNDEPQMRARYFDIMMDRLEHYTGEEIRSRIVYNKSFAMADFVSDYNAHKGNAYGLANTLMQTAFLKPRMKSSKIRNLYFAGQLTTPGPGVPPSIISGRVAATLVDAHLKN